MSPSMPSSSVPPSHTQVLIIGGGPAGSYAAACLAREGVQVTLLEQSKHPRYHIGESLIPSVRYYLRFIGAEDKIKNHGFTRKPGSAIKFNQFKREGYTDFVALGLENSAWNVVRSEFDHMLLNHSRSTGASVYEQTKVKSISFSPEDPSLPVAVKWIHTPPPPPPSPPASPTRFGFSNLPSSSPTATPTEGVTTFNYLIDATGRSGILSTHYFKNRHFNASLKNIAIWGYWRDVAVYGIGTPRHGAPWFEALTDESGWAWFIPLHDGTTSVGIVMNEKAFHIKNQAGPRLPPSFISRFASPEDSVLLHRYLSNLSYAPGVLKLITEQGRLANEKGGIRSASDFSYSAPSYAGNGYRIVGDAGAFIDPFFSSGVHLAMTSALSAAATICASIRHDCSESLAAKWHTQRVATSYTRFQIVVLSAYKQIRSQSDDILSDIDEDNYDRAFNFLRPVIQGASDMGARLSETELQRSLDFCVKLFNPTTPEEHERLARSGHIAKELWDASGPIVNPCVLKNVLRHLQFFGRGCGMEDQVDLEEESDTNIGSAEEDTFSDSDSNSSVDQDSDCEKVKETRRVLDKINARRVVHAEYAIHNLELEPLEEGLVVRLERGRLGLVKISELK